MTGIGTQLIGWEHPERWLDWRGPKVFSPEEDWSCPECLTARVRGGGKILLHHWIGLNEALGLIAGPRQKSGQNHLQTRSAPRKTRPGPCSIACPVRMLPPASIPSRKVGFGPPRDCEVHPPSLATPWPRATEKPERLTTVTCTVGGVPRSPLITGAFFDRVMF